MEIRTFEDEFCADYVKAYDAIEDATVSDCLSDHIDDVIPILNNRLPSYSFLAYSETVNVELYKHFLQCMAPQSLSVSFHAELSSDYSSKISFDIQYCKQNQCAMLGKNVLSNTAMIVSGEVSELPMMLEHLLQALNESYTEIKGYCFPVATPLTDTKRVFIFSPYYFLYYDSTGKVLQVYSNLPFKLASNKDPVIGVYSSIAFSQEVSEHIVKVDKFAEDVATHIEFNRPTDCITLPCITKFLRKEYAKPCSEERGSVAHLKWIEQQFIKAFNVRVS